MTYKFIEYLRNSIDYKENGAKPPARRGYSAYASESDIHKYSICNLQYSISVWGCHGKGDP